MEEDPGGAIIAMKAKDQRENLSPSRGEAIGRGIIAAVIVFINITIIITILISFTRSTLPHPAVIPT